MAARTNSITRVLNHPGAVQGYNGAQYAVPVDILDQTGTVQLSALDHQDVRITATAAITIAPPTDSQRGMYITMGLYASTALGITWNAAYLANADVALPSAFVAGKWLFLTFRCLNGTNWLLMGKTIQA